MKLVFVTGIMGNGGAERVIANLSNCFVEYGWDVEIIMIFGNKQDYQLDDRVSVKPIICKNSIRYLRPLERMRLIRQQIKDYQPDIVVSFLADVNIHVILSLLNTKYKLIVSERNDPERDPQQKWIRMLRDRVYRRANGIVFQTEDAKSYFDKYVPARVKRSIIQNPIKENLPYYQFDCHNNSIITACRLNKQKNLPLLISSIARLRADGYDCTLKVYGEGPMREELQSYIQKENLENYIELCGFEKNVHQKMASAAAFVIPSDYEGISNSMLEALAIGVPVIATDCPVGGARMNIQNGINGMLVPCNDQDSMVEAIKYVLDNKEEAYEMGKKAVSIRRRLSPKLIAEQWKSFIQEII